MKKNYYIENRYFYNHLTDGEKRLYRFMFDCLIKNIRKFIYIDKGEIYDEDLLRKTNLPVFKCKDEEYIFILKVWNAIAWDCPEFYFIDIYDFLWDENIVIMGKREDYYSAKEISEINQKLEEIYHKFDGIEDQFAVEVAVNEYISNNYDYDNLTEDYYEYSDSEKFDIKKWRRYKEKYNVAGLIKYNTGVCSAMAYLAQYIMQRKGLKVVNIEGKLKSDGEDSEGHRWLAINFEGKYYYLDVTWNNTFSKDKMDPQNMFFNVPLKEVEDYYILFDREYEDVVCDCEDYNYYNKMNLYFLDGEKLQVALKKHILSTEKNGNWNYYYFKTAVSLSKNEVLKIIKEVLDECNIKNEEYKLKKVNQYYTVAFLAK